jgi:NADH-quinone oxidoreductase subunit E
MNHDESTDVPAIDPGMVVSTASYAAPSPDRFSDGHTALSEETWGELRQIAGRYPEARSGLLPMLHLVQSVEGRVTPEGIEACAAILGISAAEVSGVATFYTMYKRKPVGDYHVGVCTNTLCAVMGGDLIFERLKEHLDVGNDETTADGKVTLEHVECNAACDYAPVMMVNWEFMDNQTPDSAVRLVDDLRAGKEVHSTRGPRLCTWREAERVLAGFPDDLADEGPSAGPASLVGLGIARDNGWTAPGGQADGRAGARTAAEPVASATGAEGSHEAERTESEGEVQRSDADLKHEDDTQGTEEAK